MADQETVLLGSQKFFFLFFFLIAVSEAAELRMEHSEGSVMVLLMRELLSGPGLDEVVLLRSEEWCSQRLLFPKVFCGVGKKLH